MTFLAGAHLGNSSRLLLRQPIFVAVANPDDQDVPVFLDQIDDQVRAVGINPHGRGELLTFSSQFRVVGKEQKGSLQSAMVPFGLRQAEPAGAIRKDGEDILDRLLDQAIDTRLDHFDSNTNSGMSRTRPPQTARICTSQATGHS